MAEDIAGRLAAWMEEQLKKDRLHLEQHHRRLVLELSREVERVASKQQSVAAVHSPSADHAQRTAASKPERELISSPALSSADGPHCGKQQPMAPEENAANDVLESRPSKDILEKPSSQKSKKKRTLHVADEPTHHSDFLFKVTHSHAFEAGFGVLILANAIFIGAEVQVNSYPLSYTLGLNTNPNLNDWTQYENDVLPAIEIVFGILFWIELLLKLLAQRSMFFCSGWNIFDTLLMVAWSAEKLASAHLVAPPTLLRILRLSRLLRLVRLFKQYELCDPLVLMISSIKSSMWVLFWSVVLLGLIMIIVALVLNNLLKDYMADPTRELDDRQKVFRYFGSFTRSMLTCFEVTLGNWVPPCRTLVESVSEWYAFLFIAYKLLVGFAVLKCIGAIFLCETMKCASMSDEMMIQQKSRAKKKFIEKMTILFHEADTSEDGVISRDEFIEIVAHDRVKFWLQAMELNIYDPAELFDMLDKEGDGTLSEEELITGMARLRGSATQIRMIMTEKLIRKDFARFGKRVQDPIDPSEMTQDPHRSFQSFDI